MTEALRSERQVPLLAEDVWLSEPAVRQRLGYSRATMIRLRGRGLPHVGTSRLRRYHWPAVLHWLSERRQTTPGRAERA